MMIQAPIFEYM